jgi:ribosomal protein S27AE
MPDIYTPRPRIVRADKRCSRCDGEQELDPALSKPPHYYQFVCRRCGRGVQTIMAVTAKVTVHCKMTAGD